jgi:Zn-finger nucleic acid-binding protein
MQTIDLKIEGKFLIERCDECMGMFFDPGELEALLDKSVSNVYHINQEQMDALRKAKRHDDFPVTYIKCPVCRKLMGRVNFGSRSGVIVDTCKNHGIWLDGGELRQLLEWTKAGGKLHHQQKELEYKKIQQQEEETKRRREAADAMSMEDKGKFGFTGSPGGFSSRRFDYDDPDDIFSALSRFVGKLFR